MVFPLCDTYFSSQESETAKPAVIDVEQTNTPPPKKKGTPPALVKFMGS